MNPAGDACKNNPLCIDVGPVPLLKNIRRDLVDPDTPKSALTKTGADGKKLKLVVCIFAVGVEIPIMLIFCCQFSDEFNTPGRTFYEDDDPYWQAVDIWYGVTQDMEVGLQVAATYLDFTYTT